MLRFLFPIAAATLVLAGSAIAQTNENLGEDRVLTRNVTAFVSSCFAAFANGTLDPAPLVQAGFQSKGKRFVLKGRKVRQLPTRENMTIKYNARKRDCTAAIGGALINIHNVTPVLIRTLASQGFDKTAASNRNEIHFSNGTNLVAVSGSSASGSVNLVSFGLKLLK